MAVVQLKVVGLLCFIMFTVADSSPKMTDDEAAAAADKSVGTNQINETPQPNKDVRVLHFIGNFPPEIIKAVQESLAKKKTASSLLIDRLIPESNKIVFVSKSSH
ncbi:hypothetical protein TNIN_274261 [Trichonephila inaurata madagascariensis]|uniref:Uncharacterized protein n=1 Tax=Trichonephila inaurata madagascariensis TaxID=2747483 RepID=A0A8X7CKE6_9ARAC|nr:hypothetical protein TNIN_274261 [Trichonephila inaurata madagascariensis]